MELNKQLKNLNKFDKLKSQFSTLKKITSPIIKIKSKLNFFLPSNNRHYKQIIEIPELIYYFFFIKINKIK